MCVRFGRALLCIRSVPGSKTLLGNGKNTGEDKTRGKKVKIWKNSLVLTGDLCLVVGIWGPVGDSNMGAALPCKSKVAVLQPGKSAQSMQIPACILFVKHGNLVTINRGEQKTVCADGVPIITAGNKPHQNRSHNKIFPPPPSRAALLYDFTLRVLTQKHFKSARWITNLCPRVSDSTGKEAPSIGRQMFYMYLVLNELHAYEVLNKWSLQEVFFNLVFFYIPKSLYKGPKSCKIITSVP